MTSPLYATGHLDRIKELEKEVSRLRGGCATLWDIAARLQKDMDRLEDELALFKGQRRGD